ncbi:hypothetical protein [Stenotrophomonas chelatiphaga]|uniref:hypothetical protein n=1 Tax=Stenotrophomonas chelatiphaga TaxID=517011 RepID=UPI00289ED79B|nr:hypothetical protein [Stenotrophomonas chelatiphaga]
MSTDLPVLWTPAQQAWLQAMGYSVLHEGTLAAELEAAAAAAAMAQAIEPQSVELSVAPVASRPAVTRQAPPAPRTAPEPVAPRTPVAPRPAAGDQSDTDAPPRANAARRPSVRLPDRLQIALLRASGCNPNDPQTQALMDSWPLDALRADPAAKRALWPTLRALRRKGRQA